MSSQNDTHLRVMLVEDNDVDADTIGRRLRKAHRSLTVTRARDADEAMSFLRSEAINPDLIFLDLNMPGEMSGREVLGEIRADPKLRPIPVIVLTGSNLEADRARAYALNCNAYVLKGSNQSVYADVMEQFWLNTNRFPPREK